jgi:hypothetical protein
VTLFSPAVLAGLGNLGAPIFTTPFTIYRRHVAAGGPTEDYGDDEVSYDLVGRPWPADEWSSQTVSGLLSQKLTPVQVEDSAQIVTINTYHLSVPLGTDIRTGDQVTAADEIGATTVFIVSDTNADMTLIVWIDAALRKLE